ncbi:MAG: prepilin peptidase [Phycisphaerales bacterium]|nr:MAG: prepilin peptidase [Phycisphaerales bacterium]
MLQWGAVTGASLAAALFDLRSRRIPNVLTLPFLALGYAQAAWFGGLAGLFEAIAASVLLAMPYVLLFVLGQGGAGDAKFMGSLGAWLGLAQGFVVLCCVAAAGCLLAVFKAIASGRFGAVVRNVSVWTYSFMVALISGPKGYCLVKDTPEEIVEGRSSATVPYGVAIFAGVCVGAIGVWLW